MNKPNKTPFIGWGFYSTPEGRGGIGSKELQEHQVDINLFDWQTDVAMSLKVGAARESSPHSLYSLGLHHDKIHGQMLYLRQAQHALELNSARAGTYISSFITTSQAYFKPQAVVKMLHHLHEMCMHQRREFLDEQGKFLLSIEQFRNQEVPELGLNLQNTCVPANDFLPLKEVKPALWILAQDHHELAQAIEAIIHAQLFKNYQEFYLTVSTEIIKNARLQESQYVLASHIIGLGNGLGGYLREIANLQTEVVKLKQYLAQNEQQYHQHLERREQEHASQLEGLKAQAAQALQTEQQLTATLRTNFEQQLQEQENSYKQQLIQVQQRHEQETAALHASYAKQMAENSRLATEAREKTNNSLVNEQLVKNPATPAGNNLGKGLKQQRVESNRPQTLGKNASEGGNGVRTTVPHAAQAQTQTYQEQHHTPLQPQIQSQSPSQRKLWLICCGVCILALSLLGFFALTWGSEEEPTCVVPVVTPVPEPSYQEQYNFPSEPSSTPQENPAPSPQPSVIPPQETPAPKPSVPLQPSASSSLR